MSLLQQARTVEAPAKVGRRALHVWHGRMHVLHGGMPLSDYAWAIAFAVPYVCLFLAFVIYPICYGFWLGGNPKLYMELATDPHYVTAMINTIIYVGIGVNVKMAIAFLLSGFFMRKSWWTKGLLVLYILPWAMPALPAFMSMHWMLNGQWGFLNSVLYEWFHIEGPYYLNDRWLGMTSNIAAYIWKNMPFWTVIFLAGRMAIPQELYEAAAIDGASKLRIFRHITVPLMAQLYLVSTLLSTIFSLGDFNAVFFVSGGGPAMSTEVLATIGIRYAFDIGDPRLGVAAVLTSLPLLVPLVVLLMRMLRKQEVQL
jgi:multiple sugar transport system permease protein